MPTLSFPLTRGERFAASAPTLVHPATEVAHIARTKTCQAISTAGRCTRPATVVFERSGGLVAVCASHVPA